MQYGLRRPPKVNDLRLACRYVAQLIRWHKRMAKQYPEMFDFQRIDRERREEAARQKWEQEIQAILQRVYGTPET